MSFWKTIKELILGDPLKDQFEKMIAEEAKQEPLLLTDPAPAAVKDQITDSVTAPAPVKPKRARTTKGRLKADDKSTPDVNEAWEGGKAPAKKAKAPRKKK